MAHIVIDNDDRCTCNCADKCAVMQKSGSMARCTAEELAEAGYQTFKPVVTEKKGLLYSVKKTCSWIFTGQLNNISRREV